MDIKLIASDLDGTIIDRNNHISEKTLRLFLKFIIKILILLFVQENLILFLKKFVNNLMLLMEYLEMVLKL